MAKKPKPARRAGDGWDCPFPYKTGKDVAGAWWWPETCPRPGTAAFQRGVTDRMPDDVPILKADDVCLDAYQKGRRKALCEWMEQTFDRCGGWVEMVARVVLREVFAEELGVRLMTADFEDHPKATPALAAACWNKMLDRLGYETAPAPDPDEDYFK